MGTELDNMPMILRRRKPSTDALKYFKKFHRLREAIWAAEDGYEFTLDKDGVRNGLKCTADNVQQILDDIPELCENFVYDELAMRVLVKHPLLLSPASYGKSQTDFPKYIDDEVAIDLRNFLQALGMRFADRDPCVVTGVVIQAQKQKVHKVRDMLTAEKWDGVERCKYIAIKALSAQNNHLTQVLSEKFMIGAVRVALTKNRKGYKFDSALYLHGDKGIGKSTFVKDLFGEFYHTGINSLQGREAARSLVGKWGVEIEEGDVFNKKSVGELKGFLSRAVDNARLNYQNFDTTFVRRSVFVVTINDTQFLEDGADDRRFWIIKCKKGRKGRYDPNFVKDNFQQLWAEAYHKAQDPEYKTFLDDKESQALYELQKSFCVEDPLASRVKAYIKFRHPATGEKINITDIHAYVFPNSLPSNAKAAAGVIGRTMKELGYKAERPSRGGDRSTIYVRVK